jgi:hypothetical protein
MISNVHELIKNPPKVHEWTEGEITASGLPDQTFLYLDKILKPSMRTLETGMGISTALFAMKGTTHVCINPEDSEKQRLIAYCARNGLSVDKMEFVLKTSDLAVFDQACSGEFDVLLIDGGHGFPTPMIDFHYYASKLKVGGILLLDDTQLWSVRILEEFLKGSEDWEYDATLPAKTGVFKRLTNEPVSKEWCFQPYVVKKTNELELAATVANSGNKGWLAKLFG